MAAYSAPLALAPSVRHGLLDTGLRLFEEQGFSHVSLADIATAAGQPLAEIYRHFGSKDDFVLGLYQRIHDELEARASDLPAGPLALRFQALVLLKLELLAPHQGTLRAQMAALLLTGRASPAGPGASTPTSTASCTAPSWSPAARAASLWPTLF